MHSNKDQVEVNTVLGADHEAAIPTFKDIIEEVQELRDLLREETECLRGMDVLAVKALHERKLTLIRRIEIHKELVRKHHQLLGDKTPEDIATFMRLAGEIDTVIAENYQEVRLAKEVNREVIQAITYAAQKHEHRASGYDRYGEDVSTRIPPKDALAITIRESI